MKYFEVTVNIRLESESKAGIKIKNIKELYLVDAMSVTEAESRVVDLFAKSGFSQDYEVVGVKGSKIVEVIEATTKKLTRISSRVKKDGESEGDDDDSTDDLK